MANPTNIPHVFIDWSQASVDIEAFIRELSQDRPAQTLLRGQIIGIRTARVGGTVSVYPPGTITRLDDQVWVQTGRGHLAIDRILVGPMETSAADYLASRGLAAGDAFDSVSWADHNTSKELPHAA